MTVKELMKKLSSGGIRDDNEVFIILNVGVSDRSIISIDLSLKDIEWTADYEAMGRVILKF